MKSLIIALISLTSLSTLASRIPFCTITFSGTTEGSGIYQPMHQKITNSLVKYDYHFENLKIDASFALDVNNKGMILMIDKASGRVLSSTYAALLDGEKEELEAYLDLNGATYQVDCKYDNEVLESDKAETPFEL